MDYVSKQPNLYFETPKKMTLDGIPGKVSRLQVQWIRDYQERYDINPIPIVKNALTAMMVGIANFTGVLQEMLDAMQSSKGRKQFSEMRPGEDPSDSWKAWLVEHGCVCADLFNAAYHIGRDEKKAAKWFAADPEFADINAQVKAGKHAKEASGRKRFGIG